MNELPKNRKKIELYVYSGLVLMLSFFLFVEGKKSVKLQNQIELGSQELFRKIARSQIKLQIIDVRSAATQAYDEAHIPGAIPLPNCDFSQADPQAKKYIFSYAPTVIVSERGDGEEFRKCLPFFKSVQNLAGGFNRWQDSRFPEEPGEYTPPKANAGGGCL